MNLNGEPARALPNLAMNNEPRYLEIERLLHRAHDGDREALGMLLERYRRHMSFLAQSQIDPLLRVKVDASDLAQDTCLEAHRHFGQFRGTTEAEFGAWLRKILAGLLANSVRRYKGTKQRDVRRERSTSKDSNETTVASTVEAIARDGTPSEQVMRHETSLQLASAVDQLAPDYRRVIDLRNLEGLSFAEVSERMGRSVDSVEKLWSRALGKLRRVLPFFQWMSRPGSGGAVIRRVAFRAYHATARQGRQNLKVVLSGIQRLSGLFDAPAIA